MSEILVIVALILLIIIVIKHNKNKKSISASYKQALRQPIRRNQPAQSKKAESTTTQEASVNDIHSIDYDGRHMQDAIRFRDLAREAFKEGRNNDAWNYHSKESEGYAEHARAMGFSAINTICLCNSVGEARANILRVEGKHLDAFFHIFLWVATSKHRKIKKHEQKLQAYFNRCKFKELTLDEVKIYINDLDENEAINTVKIINQFEAWRDDEK